MSLLRLTYLTRTRTELGAERRSERCSCSRALKLTSALVARRRVWSNAGRVWRHCVPSDTNPFQRSIIRPVAVFALERRPTTQSAKRLIIATWLHAKRFERSLSPTTEGSSQRWVKFTESIVYWKCGKTSKFWAPHHSLTVTSERWGNLNFHLLKIYSKSQIVFAVSKYLLLESVALCMT